MALSDLLKSGSKAQARTAPAVQAPPKAGKAGRKASASEALPPPAKSVSRPPTASVWYKSHPGQGLTIGFGFQHTAAEVLSLIEQSRAGLPVGTGGTFKLNGEEGRTKGYVFLVPNHVPLKAVADLLASKGIR